MKKTKDISKRKPKRDKPSVSYVLGLRHKTPSYFSLQWTFVEPVEITVTVKGPANPLEPYRPNEFMLCSGPYIYVFDAFGATKKSNEPFSFHRQISVFESTGTFVRGVAGDDELRLAWGGSYIARIVNGNIEQGKTICVQDILSTGRQIVSIRTGEPLKAEIYYTDGVIEIVEIEKNKFFFTLKLLQRFRLPIELREKVTAASAQLPQTEIGAEKPKTLFLGTNHGRIIVIEKEIPLFTVNPEINSPIRQIINVISKNTEAAPAIMILFENGSIVYWYNYQKDRTNFVEIKGRFTYLHQSSRSNMFAMMAHNWDYVFAGDKDGNLTIFWVSDKIIKIARTVKHVASNKITVITDASVYNLFIGTELGDYHLLELMQFYGLFYDPRLPQCVIDSRYYYKTSLGWYFLKDNQFCMTTKTGEVTVIKDCLEKKRLKMKYLCCTTKPEREIAAAYNEFGVTTNIRDFKSMEIFNWCSDPKIKQRVTKVILMSCYILIQYDQQSAELLYIDSVKITCLSIIRCKNMQGTITSAACLEKYEEEKKSATKILHLLIGCRNGQLKSDIIEWNMNTMKANQRSSHEIHVPNGYIVSMIDNQKRIADCITLNYNGMTTLVSAEDAKRDSIYVLNGQQDLSPLIGKGHSLFETSEGILAAGFKQHTLNVCWISMDIILPPQHSFLFCVDTRSSRLPYTIIEDREWMEKKKSNAIKECSKVIVSYHSENGIKEQCFPIFKPHSVNDIKNTGIIISCYVRNCFRYRLKERVEGFYFKEDEDEEIKDFVIYTGDTDGRLCGWTLEYENCYVRKYKYYVEYKLAGAVTSIHRFETIDLLAVATSQGYLYTYRTSLYFQTFPMNPLKMNKKINYLTNYIDDQDKLLHILVFMEDGTVNDVVVKSDAHITTNLDVDIQKVAQFPVATKMAFNVTAENGRYIAVLGIDGILRRIQLSPPIEGTIEMGWTISVIKHDYFYKMKLLMVGDPHGWVYVMVSDKENTFYFEVDSHHKHEIIDIIYQVTKEDEIFISSLDITGAVVIRKMKWPKKSVDPLQAKFPMFWTSPVPSPRKLLDIPEREIMVVGKGVATKIF